MEHLRKFVETMLLVNTCWKAFVQTQYRAIVMLSYLPN